MVRRLQRREVLTTILLQGLFALLIVLTIWCIPVHVLLFDYLYGSEFNGVETYSWAPPSLSLTIPLERITDHVIIKQRLVAGPKYEDTRQLKVLAKSNLYLSSLLDLKFDIKGGEPRSYVYLLRASGNALLINYLIEPLKNNFGNDKRSLGFIIYKTSVIYPKGSIFPSLNSIALIFLPFLTFLIISVFGEMNNRWFFSAITTLLVIFMYIYSPKDIIIPIFSILSSMCVLFVFGIIINRFLQKHHKIEVLTVYSIATTMVPWIYIISGAKNIGRHWEYYQPLGWILLIVPPIAGILSILLKPREITALFIASLSLCSAAVWGCINFYHQLIDYSYDFTAYYNALLRFQSDQPIYDLERVETPFASFLYKYPTFFLFIILPITNLPLEDATLVFKVFSTIAVIISTILVTLSRNSVRASFIVLSILITINFSPLQWSIHLGQVDSMLLLGISIAIALKDRYHGLISSVVLGFLGLIKIYPFFMLVISFIERKWIHLVAAMITVGICWICSILYFGWKNELDFWRVTMMTSGQRTARLSNQSIYAVIARLQDPASAHARDENIVSYIGNLGHFLFSLLVLGTTIGVLWRLRNILRYIQWEAYSLLICCMLLLIPVAWDHYQTILLIPLLIGLDYTCKCHRHSVTMTFIIAYALLAFGTFKNIAVGIMPSSIVLFFASYRTFGLVILWAWWVYVLSHWQSRQETTPTV